MVSGLLNFRKARRALTFGVVAGLLAGCQITVPQAGGTTTVDRDQPVPVALLLPYGSGQSGDEVVAKAIEDAARLAVADLDGVQVDLRIYNTAGNGSTGAAAATTAVADGAQVILGPLYADVAAAVGVAVAGDDVPVLSFSNNTSVAGGNVYLLGNTFENTARRLMTYGASQGRNKVTVLHSSDATGEVARTAVTRAAQQSGVTVAAAVSYELSQAGVVNAIPNVRSTLRSTGSNTLMLTSSTSGALPLFAELLPEAGVSTTQVQFMGLSRWDIPAEALQLKGLQGGWFTLPDPGLAAQFASRYQGATGRSPHPLAGLGYDGISAIGSIVSAGSNFDSATLTRSSGFAGVSGVFRFRADGTNDRALAIAQIVDQQIQVISPAPRRFGAAGS